MVPWYNMVYSVGSDKRKSMAVRALLGGWILPTQYYTANLAGRDMFQARAQHTAAAAVAVISRRAVGDN